MQQDILTHLEILMVVFVMFWYVTIPTAILSGLVGYTSKTASAVWKLCAVVVGCYLGIVMAAASYPGDSGIGYVLLGLVAYGPVYVLIPFAVGQLAARYLGRVKISVTKI